MGNFFELSNMTTVVFNVFTFSSSIFLFDIVFGKKPMKYSLSVGRPDRTADEVKAEGPGIEVILISLSLNILTSLYPGSEMSGVPASDNIATLNPFKMSFNITCLSF